MKKKIIAFLNESYAATATKVMTEKFGNISFACHFSLMERGFTANYKSQGVKKDREIDAFFDGLETGYQNALVLIKNSEL